MGVEHEFGGELNAGGIRGIEKAYCPGVGGWGGVGSARETEEIPVSTEDRYTSPRNPIG